MSKITLFLVTVLLIVFSAPQLFADDSSADLNDDRIVNLEDYSIFGLRYFYNTSDLNDLALIKSQWLNEGTLDDPCNMIWVDINDPGVDVDGDGIADHEPFVGQMSKYETTNAQYCQFLNDALASGDITVGTNNIVYGATGSNAGADFVGEVYFCTYTSGAYQCSQIIYDDGIFSVRSRDGYDMSNHPVVYVNWYGSTAFCNYYNYRLPTDSEWQAVADYDGSYTYGCGTTIDHSKANYDLDNPLGLTSQPYTSPVNYYQSYGYGMNDMAGNVCEWTDSLYNPQYIDRVLRGGGHLHGSSYCEISYISIATQYDTFSHIGFRVCRNVAPLQIPNVINMTQSDAESAIVTAGFVAGIITEQYSNTIPAGNIISQNPSPDELIQAGEAVDFVVSLGLNPDTPNITWVSINDSGEAMKDPNGNPISHEGFNGEMSKYETTNAQYCQYLNTALASGDISVNESYVVGTSGPYSGKNYYYLAGEGTTSCGATNGGASRINWTGSSFTVDSGFENHPVTYVSWYGSTAFASYYGWRLPTEWEWQAVADYDGSYTYGCGTTINNIKANYEGSIHPDGTTTVSEFGTYGYGMADMAGNVYEWTDSLYNPQYSQRVVRGGSWNLIYLNCNVSLRCNYGPYGMSFDIGLRVCR